MDDRIARDEAAVLARTVLSTSHEATCARLDGAEHGCAGTVGLLAAGGEPFLVPSDPEDFFATGTALSVRIAIPEVGVLHATGTTAPVRLAADDPGVVRTIQDHRGCLLGPVDPALLRVVPLRLSGLAIAVPGAGTAQTLTPGELAAASPDWLLARGRRLTEHLEQNHADDLARLAAAHGVPSATAVTLGRLTTRAARLVCLGAEGVTTVDMVFDPPVRNPAELWRRLATAQAAS
ncbi:DUF2470 domain-containing protein [Microlunatus antarcticus]|uniref:DUF2470 domain-containing protein n=1 Tax=Microlunatus antarcticus TaxID=53388 RepID=A0A7W5P870_9ACTN|nr:DUF2470 domain-containing protein [Microlunatus antarcticus]MBB3327636.1 hypothetical protein [Microlunatus antarcticus]